MPILWPAGPTLLMGRHALSYAAALEDVAWPAGTTVTLPVISLASDGDEQRRPERRATIVCPIPTEATLTTISPLTGTLKCKIWIGYGPDAATLDQRHWGTLLVRRRLVDRPSGTMTLDLATADIDWVDSDITVTVT